MKKEQNKKLKKNKLTEDGRHRDFMTDEEKKLQRKLIRLLRDDGQGHHHAAYAKRLAKFDVNIVPLGKEPGTAAISFDEGIIYINRGFLRDPKTFGQLNVIMRHELCHNLLMHQFRMINKLADTIPELNLKTSSSIHEMLNALEDFDISNKKYSKEDKDTVRNLWINGKLMSGLVTEDHRASWINYPLERMYDAIIAEIEKYGNTGQVAVGPKGPSNLNIYAKNMHTYKSAATTLADHNTLDEFRNEIMGDALKYDKNAKMPENWSVIIDSLEQEMVTNKQYASKEIKDLINDIASTKVTQRYDFISKDSGEVLFTLYTPEEKLIAIECLKIINSADDYDADYQRWYDEIKRKLENSSYTDDQIKELRDLLN